jgi:DNA polymerase-3 subunit delta'
MSTSDDDIPHPRETTTLTGHDAAEQALLEAYRSGRMHHAWLIAGPAGIGKATLAYRMARFALAHPDPTAPQVQAAQSLALDPDHPVARRVAAQAHGDLMELERTEDDKGKMRTVITVDQVRRTVSFFGSTASEGGWRVCLIDQVDELQFPNAANALLKVLEEPPPRTLLLLVSNAPGQLLPTIRSRCRRLALRGLDAGDVASVVAGLLGREADEADIAAAAAGASGSVGRALALLEGPALALRERVLALLDQLPNADPNALHALGEALGGSDSAPLAAFVDTVNGWLSARLASGEGDKRALVRTAEAFSAINAAARDADTYNLERKPLVFSVFGQLAEAVRG